MLHIALCLRISCSPPPPLACLNSPHSLMLSHNSTHLLFPTHTQQIANKPKPQQTCPSTTSKNKNESMPPPVHSEKYDDVLLSLAAQQGGIEPLLQTFFSFLHRKTDFYVTYPQGAHSPMGFPPGAAERMLLQNFHAFPYKPTAGAGGTGRTAGAATSSRAPPAPAPAPAPTPAPGPTPPSNPTTTTTKSPPTIQYTPDGKQIPLPGNGGVTESYWWTQTLQDVTVYLPLKGTPPAVQSKQVACDWTSTTVKVRVRGEVILEGTFGSSSNNNTSSSSSSSSSRSSSSGNERIKPQDSLWTLEDKGTTLVLTLEKATPIWWGSVMVGDPEIDTAQVDSTKKGVEDYDAVTQGELRKIMFDQRQKALGLPTSDQLKVEEMIEKVKYMPGSPFLAAAGQEKDDEDRGGRQET